MYVGENNDYGMMKKKHDRFKFETGRVLCKCRIKTIASTFQ